MHHPLPSHTFRFSFLPSLLSPPTRDTRETPKVKSNKTDTTQRCVYPWIHTDVRIHELRQCVYPLTQIKLTRHKDVCIRGYPKMSVSMNSDKLHELRRRFHDSTAAMCATGTPSAAGTLSFIHELRQLPRTQGLLPYTVSRYTSC